jgi:hypothetical protein
VIAHAIAAKAPEHLRPRVIAVAERALATLPHVSFSIDREDERLMDRFAREGSRGYLAGTFTGSIDLYRVVDDNELWWLALGWQTAPHRVGEARIQGGSFSVEHERARGASWGADKEDVLSFGRNWAAGKRGRLGKRQWLLVADTLGERFGHLDARRKMPGSAPDRPVLLQEGEHRILTSTFNTGLGASMAPPVRKVVAREVKGESLGPEVRLTQLVKERAEQLAANPELLRKWYRAHSAEREAYRILKRWRAMSEELYTRKITKKAAKEWIRDVVGQLEEDAADSGEAIKIVDLIRMEAKHRL